MDFMKLFDADDKLTRPDILDRLERFSKELRERSTIIVIGASSIILTIDSERKTTDIDILNTVKVASYAKYDIQIVNEGILFLCADYRDRLVLQAEFNSILIYSLGLLDVALVKLGRGLDKDIDDVKEILQSGKISLEAFVSKYTEFRSGYGGSFDLLDNNYWSATGKRFIADDRLF